MITNESVLAWLKTLSVTADNYYCGTLDKKKDCSFGVYNAGDKYDFEMSIGGKETTKTALHAGTILVHWNNSTRKTQDKAIALYEAIRDAEDVEIGGYKVDIIAMRYNEPIDVGTDDNGICEYVIDFIIYYERS